MKIKKNRVNSFEVFVRLDEQMETQNSTTKMMQNKLKSIAYNASAALSILESNPSAMVEPYIIAQVAVAADYLEGIDEYFRNMESGAAVPATPAMTPSTEMPSEASATEEGEDEEEEDMEPGESVDDETEDEVEDSSEEDQEKTDKEESEEE